MSKKIKALITVGGTGGHVFPGCNLASHLIERDYNVQLITDARGLKFLSKFKNFNILEIPSFSLIKKNILTKFLSIFLIFYSLLRSFIYLFFNRPDIIFGMGGYASLPICLAARALKIKFIIYENNFIIGKVNKYLLPFAEKIFVSNKGLEGIPGKYSFKVFEIGNIINKEILNFSVKNLKSIDSEKLNILIIGGSQAAKVFAVRLPQIFKKCSELGFRIRIFQHCLPSQNDHLKSFYENSKIEYEIFNFSNNILEYFKKTNLALTRSGSSTLAELTNLNVPFISIPLPSSADNHQLKNALFYKNKDIGFLIEEKDLEKQLFGLLKRIYHDRSILDQIIQNQSQYSDKNVYNNINQILKKITNEKY